MTYTAFMTATRKVLLGFIASIGAVTCYLIGYFRSQRQVVEATEEVIDFIVWQLEMQGIDPAVIFDSDTELDDNPIGPTEYS